MNDEVVNVDELRLDRGIDDVTRISITINFVNWTNYTAAEICFSLFEIHCDRLRLARSVDVIFLIR